MITWWALSLMIIASFTSAYAGLLLKRGSQKVKNRRSMVLLAIGLGLYAFSAILTILAYLGGDLIVIFPLTSLPYIWTLFIAKKHLGEIINSKKIAGVSLIILGIFIVII